MKAVTIKDVAELAGVSFSTVSHVVNGTRFVAPETALKVEQAIAALGYRPCSQARSLRTGSSGLIGVMTTHGNDVFFSEVLCGIEDACRDTGRGIIVTHTEGDPDREAECVEMLLTKGVDGFILNNLTGNPKALNLLENYTVPLVMLQAVSPGQPMDIVRADDRQGALQAVSLLLRLGHRKIACIAGFSLPHHCIRERRAVFLEVLEAAGIENGEKYFVYGDYSLEGGYECAKDFLCTDDPPTAFFCYSDLMAMGAIRAAADLGVRVPEDVSIVGFDDISLASCTVPRLSTVRQPKEELGRNAVFRILERAAGSPAVPQTMTLGVELIERESTGPLRT